MKRKREKIYKRVKLNKYFAPLILCSFCVSIYLLVNFQQISYNMNKEMFQKVEGVVSEKTVDSILSLIPVDNISYTYDSKDYNFDLYDIYGLKKNDEISVYVNKTAPSFIFVLNDNYISKYNDVFYIIFLICTLIYIRKLYYCIKYKSQRKELKKSKKQKNATY